MIMVAVLLVNGSLILMRSQREILLFLPPTVPPSLQRELQWQRLKRIRIQRETLQPSTFMISILPTLHPNPTHLPCAVLLDLSVPTTNLGSSTPFFLLRLI
jgi:hypothetical protein